jgi:hypothetical protein
MPCDMAQTECTAHDEAPVDRTALDEFSEQERERLARLRRAVMRGERSETYPVDKRQDFIRWLVDKGKISESGVRAGGKPRARRASRPTSHEAGG